MGGWGHEGTLIPGSRSVSRSHFYEGTPLQTRFPTLFLFFGAMKIIVMRFYRRMPFARTNDVGRKWNNGSGFVAGIVELIISKTVSRERSENPWNRGIFLKSVTKNNESAEFPGERLSGEMNLEWEGVGEREWIFRSRGEEAETEWEAEWMGGETGAKKQKQNEKQNEWRYRISAGEQIQK